MAKMDGTLRSLLEKIAKTYHDMSLDGSNAQLTINGQSLSQLLEDFHWDETRFPVKSALTASSTPSQRMKNSAARSSSSTSARRRPSAPSTRKGPTSVVLSARASASLQMPWYSARRNCRVSKSSARIRSFAATPSKVCRPVSSMASSAR